MPSFWRPNKVSDDVSLLGYPMNFEMANKDMVLNGDRPKDMIPSGKILSYPLVSLVGMSSEPSFVYLYVCYM